MEGRMKQQTDKLLLVLKNTTDKTQHLNLFDDGDLDSGGAFTPVSGQRTAKYDMSTQDFTQEMMQVVVTYNSVSYPILHFNGWNTGILTYILLLSYLNSLGIGTFTDQGGQIVYTIPNYPLVDDNGGMPAVEIKISVVGTCTFVVDNLSGNVTGPVTLTDVGTDLPDVTYNVTPNGEYQGGAPCITGGYDQKQVTVLGTAPSGANWQVTLTKNGNVLFQDSGVGPSVSWASGGFSVNPGDTITVTFTIPVTGT